MYQESWLKLLEEFLSWIYANLSLFIGSGIVSVVVSGIVGYFTRKRLVVRAERRDHLKDIQKEAIQSMLSALKRLPAEVEENLGRISASPSEMSLKQPTESRLFDVVKDHFSELWKEWKILDNKLVEDSRIAIEFYGKIEKELVEQTGLEFESSVKGAPYLWNEFLGWLFCRFKEQPSDLMKRVKVEPFSDTFFLKADEIWVLTSGSRDAMEKIVPVVPKVFDSLKTASPDFKTMHLKFLDQLKKTEGLALDALAQTRLKRKCRFCP